jgi:hypothetical protein
MYIGTTPFEQYPDYRILAYPTHGDFGVNELNKERATWNAPTPR